MYVPARIIDNIASKVQAVGECSHHGIIIHIKDLTKYEVNGKKLATELVNEVNKFVDFDPLNYNLNPRTGYLRLIETRKSFHTSNYYYVEPVSKAFNFDHDYDSKRHFRYVVLLEPLKSLCTVPNIEHLLRSQQNSTDGLTQLVDGTVFKSNIFRNKNPDTIRLILYHDSFEIANPLRLTKKTHWQFVIHLVIQKNVLLLWK